MKDQIEPDQWRPIIAAALFYKKTLRNRRVIGIILSAVVFVVLAAILFFGLPILFPQSYTSVDKYGVTHTGPLGTFIAPFVAPLVAIFGTTLLSIILLKRLRLLADKDAADIVGAPIFITLLTKIQGLDTNGHGKTNNRRAAGVGWLPSLQQRILKLQTYQGP
jgi:hypothetical protein